MSEGRGDVAHEHGTVTRWIRAEAERSQQQGSGEVEAVFGYVVMRESYIKNCRLDGCDISVCDGNR